ncbi:hypothetical protein EXD82_06355 [Peptacetobacter hominis]|uniref:Uncharacterized protein n=1 Tax=Peptacetobacter hominis TaxID=2743610 RepID=A0A544QUN2_9FIRM|nr:hypothetical protein [Peptacetobacter hominis]TQQ84423.1 hypothetical protein EXD82_06355 [Peptacetobacter hominis]
MKSAKAAENNDRRDKNIHWKGALYTLCFALAVYLIKGFVVDNVTSPLVIYPGVIFMVLGFALSIVEKAMNIDFFNAIPNWQGAGVMVNACCLVGIGLGLVFPTFSHFVGGSTIIAFILAAQRTLMTNK